MEDLAAEKNGDRAEVPEANIVQVQFSLWVTGRSLWYYVSFNPAHDESTDLLILTVERDEPMIKKLASRASIMREFILAAYERFTGTDVIKIDMERLTRWVHSKPFDRIPLFHKEIAA
jgi:hypothetical protein